MLLRVVHLYMFMHVYTSVVASSNIHVHVYIIYFELSIIAHVVNAHVHVPIRRKN